MVDARAYSTYNETNRYIFERESSLVLTGLRDGSDSYTSYPLILGNKDETLALDNLEKLDGFKEDTTYTINIVSSVEISGGPEDPFESITIQVPRKKLLATYPELDVDSVILPGFSQIQCNLMEMGTYIVTGCKLKGGSYVITGYCSAERVRGATLPYSLSANSVFEIAHMILTSSIYGCGLPTNRIVSNIAPNQSGVKRYYFKKGVNSWTALQLCAMALNARIFFTGNCAFLVDYTKLTPGKLFNTSRLVLNGPNPTPDLDVMGSTSLGGEGADTIINALDLKYYKKNGDKSYLEDDEVMKYDLSVSKYGETAYNLNLTRYLPDDPDVHAEFAEPIFNFFRNYRSEPMQSIGFTVPEKCFVGTRTTGSWVARFPTVYAYSEISSPEDEVVIKARSHIETEPGSTVKKTCPQMLSLSTYKRHFPKMTTEYWWGIASSISLSSSTSQIVTKME